MRIGVVATGDIALPVLTTLLESQEHHVLALITQPDRPAGRTQQLRAPAVKALAQRHFVPIFQPDRIRDQAAVDQIRYLRPDVLVVMAYGQILPRSILRLPAVACLNLHASLLPRHRGAAPIQAAIEAGDRKTGITVMYMAEGLDTGDVLLQKEITIRRRETGGSLHDRLAALAPAALLEALRDLKNGVAPRAAQNETEATYAAKLTRESGRIDWHADSGQIERKVRAMNPWPGAFTTMPEARGMKKLKIFSTIKSSRSGAPGEVLAADRHGVLVACGCGALLLREVQLEGRTRLSPREFHAGHPIATGTVMGGASGI